MTTLSEKLSQAKKTVGNLSVTQDSSVKEALAQIFEVLEQISVEITQLNERQNEALELIVEVDEDLGMLEDLIYENEDQNEFIEINCPSCKEIICIDESMLEVQDEVLCPNCGTACFTAKNQDKP